MAVDVESWDQNSDVSQPCCFGLMLYITKPIYEIPQYIIEVGLAKVEWQSKNGTQPWCKSEHLSQCLLPTPARTIKDSRLML
jgi:hypothetical protein